MQEKDPYLDSPEFSQATYAQYLGIILAAKRRFENFGRTMVDPDGIFKVTDLGIALFSDLNEFSDYDWVSIKFTYGGADKDPLIDFDPSLEFRFFQTLDPIKGDRKVIREHIISIFAEYKDGVWSVAPYVNDTEHYEGESNRVFSSKKRFTNLDMNNTESVLARAQEISASLDDFEEKIGINDRNILTSRQVEQLGVLAERIV